jgi:hypothetical protein
VRGGIVRRGELQSVREGEGRRGKGRGADGDVGGSVRLVEAACLIM